MDVLRYNTENFTELLEGALRVSVYPLILKNKLASSKLRYSETMTRSLTHSLTGVKCRATSVAKKLLMMVIITIINVI